ncbi:insecticidal delta-endotoxin Cry8Ea1 family protein [Xanthovirga aplysinae]|uniref:insecticidal delta-endotoxin Cry8Ea1 family protein n=1 Tax=Xanthovirga aplysinae TaxID=2529853 RepID=UPI0012BCA674|nr:insecticidal delta-endotoxin Cry8Ea1 family protein [Xanthovirga aplysinae]MTI30993.1 hypothetical protein [Xanthovirga aplysinae]
MKPKINSRFSRSIVLTITLGFLLPACQPDFLNEVEDNNAKANFAQINALTTSDDIYSLTRDLTIRTLSSKIPGVGFLVGGFVNALWPGTSTDPWDQIKDRVEALIDEKISEYNYNQVQLALDGIKNNMDEYLWAVQNSETPTYISEKYNIVLGDILSNLPHFQANDDRVLLLPLFSQLANLHLSLLRDGAEFGLEWGWSDVEVDRSRQQLIDAIKDYSSYADEVYAEGLADVESNLSSNKRVAFNKKNKYIREMTLSVLDFKEMWQYYDISQYPDGASIYLDREIYSDVVGAYRGDKAVNLPSTPPSQPISKLEVWGYDRIDAVRVTYPEGGGPDGVTQTKRMGNTSGGTLDSPYGGVFDLSSLPVEGVFVQYGDIMDEIQLIFSDGSQSTLLGGHYLGGHIQSTYSYPGHILSSIWINGAAGSPYWSADFGVFGFKLENNQMVSTEALKSMYIGSPIELSNEEINNLMGNSSSKAVSIQSNSFPLVDSWKAERDQYWEKIGQNVEKRSGAH